jgi:hypothetical protein
MTRYRHQRYRLFWFRKLLILGCAAIIYWRVAISWSLLIQEEEENLSLAVAANNKEEQSHLPPAPVVSVMVVVVPQEPQDMAFQNSTTTVDKPQPQPQGKVQQSTTNIMEEDSDENDPPPLIETSRLESNSNSHGDETPKKSSKSTAQKSRASEHGMKEQETKNHRPLTFRNESTTTTTTTVATSIVKTPGKELGQEHDADEDSTMMANNNTISSDPSPMWWKQYVPALTRVWKPRKPMSWCIQETEYNPPCTWCDDSLHHTLPWKLGPKQEAVGMIYVKTYKTSSSTAEGISWNIAHHMGQRLYPTTTDIHTTENSSSSSTASNANAANTNFCTAHTRHEFADAKLHDRHATCPIRSFLKLLAKRRLTPTTIPPLSILSNKK